MKNLLMIGLLLVTSVSAGNFNSHLFCKTTSGSEIWEERFYGEGKPVSVVWAIDWSNYPNHRTVVLTTDKPINFGLFCN
jgi:hypothetical protein